MPATRTTLLSALVYAVSAMSVARAAVVTRQAGTSIVIGNDDGWAEGNVRALYSAVRSTGWNAVLSAPAENKSGSGSSSAAPKPLEGQGQYGSIPAGAPGIGSDAKDDHVWYVNAYPVDGVEYGINTLAPKYLAGKPSLVATGPNVGSNLGLSTIVSGTVGAAAAGVNLGIPAIAFSGATSRTHSYTTNVPGDESSVYAAASVNLIKSLLASGVPYLPAGIFLNVNYPEAGPSTDCKSASDVKWVLSRIYWNPLRTDVEICSNGKHLVTETEVVGTDGCYASISVTKASNKRDAEIPEQKVVYDKLASILTCLP